MSFPYSITKKYSFPEEKYLGLTKTYLRKAIITVFADDEFEKEEDNTIRYKSKHSLINFNYHYDIVFEKDEGTKIKFIINLANLLQITVGLLVMIALLSKFGFRNYLIFSGIFLVVFYFANLIFIQSRISRKVNKALNMLGYDIESDFSPEQKQWLADETKCPACGGDITENDIVCKSCGLKIKQNRFTKPLNLNQNKEQGQIKYHYKEKKD
jgi:hypothetical protein